MGLLRDGDEIDWLLRNVPEGWTEVQLDGQRWAVTRTRRAGGRALTFGAEQLGTAEGFGANVWITSDGPVLRPCEVPAEQVLGFVRALADTDLADHGTSDDDPHE